MARYTLLHQFVKQITPPLLLVHQTRPQSPSQMSLNHLKLYRLLGHNEIARPTNIPTIQFSGNITVSDGRRDSMSDITQKISAATRAGLMQGVSTVFD